MIPNNPIAVRVYDELTPVAVFDFAKNWALLRFIEAWTAPLMPAEIVVRDDSVTGIAGWGSVLHPDTAPEEWLGWLRQLAGTKFIVGEAVVQQRKRIKNMEHLRRGHPATIKSEIQATLSNPNGTVYLLERFGSAWRGGAATLISETPDPAWTQRVFEEAVPAAIVTEYQPILGDISYNTLLFTHTTYDHVLGLYADYNEVLADPDKQ